MEIKNLVLVAFLLMTITIVCFHRPQRRLVTHAKKSKVFIRLSRFISAIAGCCEDCDRVLNAFCLGVMYKTWECLGVLLGLSKK
mgnify:CR=1 FL=1